MTKMPPQAYTKEVLATAFDWLSRQNESVKKSIRNSDDLVGLYLRSTRLKDGAGQASATSANAGLGADLSSAKSFRNELQGLALNLKQFEEKPGHPPELKIEPDYLHELNLMMSTQSGSSQGQSQNFNPNHGNSGITNPNLQMPKPNVEFQQTSMPAQKATAQIIHNDEQQMTATKENTTAVETADTVLLKLDKKTISAINLAKERLNLSSNTEAIRVLVSLGEKHLKKIFGAEE